MKIYNGIDICSINRISKALEVFGEKFINRIFTLKEKLEAKNKDGTYNINYLAKRFAGKEAFSKAIEEGIGSIAFKDISIVRGENGVPVLSLSSKAVSYLLNNKNWLEYNISVSLSDEDGINGGIAIASVIILVNKNK